MHLDVISSVYPSDPHDYFEGCLSLLAPRT